MGDAGYALIPQAGDGALPDGHIVADTDVDQDIARIAAVEIDVLDAADADSPVAHLRLRIQPADALVGHDQVIAHMLGLAAKPP